jgi:hypothetical protein
VEALACSTDHVGVIKFYAIHAETMEAHQLWWNRGTFQEMLKYHDSENQSFDNRELLQGGGPDFESHQCFVTFRQARVKLAWAFFVHHECSPIV